jgi:phospholipase/carboxylesterase
LSGFAIPAEGNAFFDDEGTKASQRPLFWGRGQADTVITEDKIEFTLDWAGEHTDLTKMLYAGMTHSVSEPEMNHVSEFLRHHVLGS